ncbi:MAG TPA: acetyl-CoA carboxylase biotin carboxyl carrier protein [Pyrinomonadaceae bacterium]|jgi:acetyl-CoA carboxylase biotin carboxyl carrier protein|nr:acetyl-CoA carboxylase biotin carboxyl carrier protein [Pyrinomonadaceae bacterium]
MSDQNQAPRVTGQEQIRASEKPQGERRGGGRHNAGRRRFQNQQPSRSPESALNIDELREVMELFTSHGLTDFELENKDVRVRLSRNQMAHASAAPATPPAGSPASNPAALPAPAASAQSALPPSQTLTVPPPAAASSPATTQGAESKSQADDENLFILTSPIVGTFYRAPSPNADPFVRAGSEVESDTVVCIIEAMKLMNEILAETSGVVEKIYVENSQPVEYGQPLFGIRK